ncbi:MAG: OmpA family protein [Elusimicrobia bacterium]|nr:OmpA family protein [Elusimicrobiota bacterium]
MAESYRERRTQENPIWLAVLSDLMTNLMLFFLVLYGFTRQPEEMRKSMTAALSDRFKGKKVDYALAKAEKVVKKFQEEETASRIDNLVKDKGIQEYTQVEISEKYVKITLKTPVLFSPGSSALKEEAMISLKEVSKALRLLPNSVIVEGHTDNVPISTKMYSSNWELSVARAYSVIDFLIKAGIPPDRFVAAGYGEYKAIASNDTEEGRMQNRRIEINVVR